MTKTIEDFNEKYLNKCKVRLIAVDFDDTITEYRPFPEVAPLDMTAKKYLDKLNNAGFTLVLWSSRVGQDYEDAYNRCIMEFDMPYIKRDSKEFKHGASGKLIASYYIDDRSNFGKVNWRKTYKYLMKKYVKNN